MLQCSSFIAHAGKLQAQIFVLYDSKNFSSYTALQLNKYLPYFPPVHVGQTVIALSNDEVKEILYHAKPNLWRKKMTKQGYNYLERSVQEMTSFFETRIENQEALAPPPNDQKPPKNKKRGSYKKHKASSYEESDKDPSEDEKSPSKKKFSQYHVNNSPSTDECTMLKALIKNDKSYKSKGFGKVSEETYT